MAAPDISAVKASDGTPLACLCCKQQVNVCVVCGKVRYPGDWPFCPHGQAAKFGDDPLEPYIDEHISADGKDWGRDQFGQMVQGTLITSRGQRRKIMEQLHLTDRKKRTDLLVGQRTHFDMRKR